MGKFLEALRPTAIRPSPMAAPTHRNNALSPVVGVEETVETNEEIPFIEVGPRKSMEASASVLAMRPIPAPAPAAAVTFRPSPGEVAPRRPHFAADVISHHQPDHSVSGQYRDLFAALIPVASRDGAKALLFAPGLPDADAGAVLLNLAVTAVREGNTHVVIVDADAKQPALADRLGLAARPGLGEVLSGVVALEKALQATDLAHLVVLTAGGAAPAGPRLVVETPASLLRRLRQRFDLVFVLGSSWGEGSEALATACDLVFLVIPEREAFSPRLDELLQTFPRQGARFGGCILAAC